MIIFQYALYALLFLLEVAGLISFSYWGFHLGKEFFIKILIGLGTPVLVAIFWGLFLAPKATYQLNEPLLSVLQLMVFTLAAAALYFSGKSSLGIAYLITVLLTKFLIYVVELNHGV
ncbi:hypothetical protein CWR48_12265 [Oceanobacillus arenosus]|uniref:DUF2568 domain-containing protein n=1 Tax=Oceanobacillus arenosus TaxID=1229153 RepID=A0A3D8PSX8_9BACI|nr:YrdB family protein [Oceanobacillus arenosus]RDW18348.1 hypothetical protein CWR48_12265 [Oceanobacillus arenosus]